MPKLFETKKSLGQHFLTSSTVPTWMCDAAEVSQGDTVLEIGPGTGVLTRELLARGAQVIALEADKRAIEVLSDTFKEELSSLQLTLYHFDVRKDDIHTTPLKDHAFKIVANIPYYLSGMLFRNFLESDLQPTLIVYLVQKEVAKRVCSDHEKGEKESLLSLSVKAYGTPTYVKSVSRGHFAPPPNVDSAIVRVGNISRDNFKNLSPQFFFELLHLGFGQKRKQLLGNLAKQYSRSTLTHIFSTLSLSDFVRAEDVSLAMWLELAQELQRVQ